MWCMIVDSDFVNDTWKILSDPPKMSYAVFTWASFLAAVQHLLNLAPFLICCCSWKMLLTNPEPPWRVLAMSWWDIWQFSKTCLLHLFKISSFCTVTGHLLFRSSRHPQPCVHSMWYLHNVLLGGAELPYILCKSCDFSWRCIFLCLELRLPDVQFYPFFCCWLSSVTQYLQKRILDTKEMLPLGTHNTLKPVRELAKFMHTLKDFFLIMNAGHERL